MSAGTEWENWEDLEDGSHYLEWKPIGYPVQEYVCVEKTLFDIETGNAVGDCSRCHDKETQ